MNWKIYVYIGMFNEILKDRLYFEIKENVLPFLYC